MSRELELLPCPFCGGEAYIETVAPHTHKIATFMPDYEGGAMAACGQCHTANWRDGANAADEVVALWNRRAALTASPQAAPEGDSRVFAGIPLDEAIKLGRRYAGENDKLRPRLAQTLEALTEAAMALASPQVQGGEAWPRLRFERFDGRCDFDVGGVTLRLSYEEACIVDAIIARMPATPQRAPGVDEAMVERASLAYEVAMDGEVYRPEVPRIAMRAALEAALASGPSGVES